MKRLNMLNQVANKDVEATHKLDHFSFYKLFLSLLNVGFTNKLTAREVDTLAAIMFICPSKDAFKGVPAQRVRDLIGMKSPNYLKMRDVLTDKGHIVDNKLSPRLSSLPMYFKAGDVIELKYLVELYEK